MSPFDELLGPMLLGLTLNTLLMGALVVQYYMYWATRYDSDPIGIKLLVIFLMVADVVNFVFDVTFVWLYTVSHFGDLHYITMSNWVFNTDPVMTVIVSSTVQAFFAWRVKQLTGKKWLYILLNISSFIQFLAGLGTTIACAMVKDFANFQSFSPIVIVWLSLSAATDVTIAATMVVYLTNHRTGIRQTEDLITKLIRFTIQTGMVTSVWAVVDLIVYLTLANNLHLIFNMTLSKLYSGACLSSLNARTVYRISDSRDKTSFIDYDDVPPGGINVVTSAVIHRDTVELDSLPSQESRRTEKSHRMGKPRRSSRHGMSSVGNPLDGGDHNGQARGLGLRVTLDGVRADSEKDINDLLNEKSISGVRSFGGEGASPSTSSPRTMVSLDLARAKTPGSHRTGSDGDEDDDSTMKA